MAKSKKKQEGVGMWVAIVVLFVLGAWPIALILLLVKLFGDDGKKKRTAAPPLNQAASAGTAAAEDSRAKKVMRSAMRSPAVKKSNAKWLKIIGAVLAVCGLAASWSPIDMMIWLGGVEIWYIEELLWARAITAAGVAMFCSGMSIDRSLKRYNKYLAVVGDYEAMAVEQLSRTLGYPRDRVEKDLQKMIDKGYFGDEAYLNMELGYLFRSGQADAELKQKRRQEQAQEAAAAPPPKETEEGYSGILRRIRRANDAIADEALSAKIDRLEAITARIFRAVEEDPDNDRNVHYLGREYLYYGRWDDCIRTLTQHLSLPSAVWRDERAASMRYIARAHARKGERDEARDWYLRAAAEAPHLREPWTDLAMLLYEDQEWDGVLYATACALKIRERPRTYICEAEAWGSLPHDLRCQAYYHTGRLPQALEEARLALAAAPSDPRLAGNAALLEKMAGTAGEL